MILENEYLSDVKEYLLAVSEDKILESNYTQSEVLANKDNMLDLF